MDFESNLSGDFDPDLSELIRLMSGGYLDDIPRCDPQLSEFERRWLHEEATTQEYENASIAAENGNDGETSEEQCYEMQHEATDQVDNALNCRGKTSTESPPNRLLLTSKVGPHIPLNSTCSNDASNGQNIASAFLIPSECWPKFKTVSEVNDNGNKRRWPENSYPEDAASSQASQQLQQPNRTGVNKKKKNKEQIIQERRNEVSVFRGILSRLDSGTIQGTDMSMIQKAIKDHVNRLKNKALQARKRHKKPPEKNAKGRKRDSDPAKDSKDAERYERLHRKTFTSAFNLINHKKSVRFILDYCIQCHITYFENNGVNVV